MPATIHPVPPIRIGRQVVVAKRNGGSSASYYTIRRGDTLSRIASRHGILREKSMPPQRPVDFPQNFQSAKIRLR